jgi:hypothetical protein
MYKKGTFMFGLLLFTVIATGTSVADEAGDPGVIKALQRNATTSDLFSSYHAMLVIKTASGDDQYKWGGNQCPGFDLTPIMEEALNDYAKEKRMQIEPFFKVGAGGNYCLVGFTALNNKVK